ncbi:hypothetical protein LFREDSHE_24990 [Shewanella baltica]
MNKSTLGKLDVLSVFITWAILISLLSTLAYLKIFADQTQVLQFLYICLELSLLLHYVTQYWRILIAALIAVNV